MSTFPVKRAKSARSNSTALARRPAEPEQRDDDEDTALARADLTPFTIMRPLAAAAELLKAKAEQRDALMASFVNGVDIIRIPNTDKDALSKAGGEKALFVFGCTEEYEIVREEIDHDRVTEVPSAWVAAPDPGWNAREELKRQKKGRNKKLADGTYEWQVPGVGTERVVGLYRYVVRCRIIRPDGRSAGSCLAACSTRETKYQNRPNDLENTVLKMAEKRAFVGAVLHAFGLSDRLTQDVEDFVEAEVVEPAARPTRAGESRPNHAAPSATGSSGATPNRSTATRTESRGGTTTPSGAADVIEKHPPAPGRSAKAIILELLQRIDDAGEDEVQLEEIAGEWAGVQSSIASHDARVGIDAYLAIAKAHAVGMLLDPEEHEVAPLAKLRELRVTEGRITHPPSEPHEQP